MAKFQLDFSLKKSTLKIMAKRFNSKEKMFVSSQSAAAVDRPTFEKYSFVLSISVVNSFDHFQRAMCFHMRFCALNVLLATIDLRKTLQLTHAKHRKFGTADIELTFTSIMPRYSNSNSCDVCRLLYVASEMCILPAIQHKYTNSVSPYFMGNICIIIQKNSCHRIKDCGIR
jgi:hypothetical protein